MSDVDVRPARAAASLRPAVAALLVVLGLGFCVLWKIASGTEQHSYDRGAVAPSFVELTGGHSYAISVPGGVATAIADGVPTSIEDDVTYLDPHCSVSGTGIGTQRLTLVPEQAGSKATEQIASFVSSVTGDVQVSCSRLSSVFIDDADDAGFDYAGVLLWLGVIALAVGLPLGLSVLRESTNVREDDEIE